ncbi:PREDICTED: ciliogenesis-associated TTC17-interacting protein isoform X1 [Bactrocera latifrons]|uniref:Ciliogenesis-associated TTC17-interacting protein n=3 Tax=Bactrocera latifrons TaxID=174628 RepID=A0A0K8V8W5_BACLA|nr:PREDICTED: ciliogenesis-associated TTC17-interacting protein isoform X1 [Bactrocera latifrons]
MDFGLFESCRLEDIPERRPEDAWEFKPCQKKFLMRPEDEISIDSIISALLSNIEPSEEQYRKCQWDVTAKEMHNEKQSLLFEEKLYISQIQTGPCKLNEENKIFLESELSDIGYMKLSIEESYDGYVVFSRSQMAKGRSRSVCGHCLRGKYSDKFLLIVEKRSEFDYIDKGRIEKNMEARINENILLVIRETKINADSQKFKAEINVKDREPVFIMDGGIQLLMRHLIINNFIGKFEYYTLNLYGKVLHGIIIVEKERKKVRIFYRNFNNVIVVKNYKYFNEVAEEKSETYFTSNGKIVLHFWPKYNYLLHALRSPPKPVERILPKLELMWKADNLLLMHYQKKKNLTLENAQCYLHNHPEIVDLFYDYIHSLLQKKPEVVFSFTIKFFQNMKNTY